VRWADNVTAFMCRLSWREKEGGEGETVSWLKHLVACLLTAGSHL